LSYVESDPGDPTRILDADWGSRRRMKDIIDFTRGIEISMNQNLSVHRVLRISATTTVIATEVFSSVQFDALDLLSIAV
jgi:hypothetical protein